MSRYIIIFFILTSLTLSAQEKITGGILDKNLNGRDQDYGAYVIYGDETDTLFFTSSRPVKREVKKALNAEIFYSTRPSSMREQNVPINEGWSKAKQIETDASRIARFTRGSQTITSDRIIFAAERDLSTETAEGTSYFLDLWEMTRNLAGFSAPRPINEVNDPDAWDSQPSISQDGNVLYFVTNRKGGAGGLDIWYSVKFKGEWQQPSPVPEINTPGNEFSPHCGSDGKFYFSTDWSYDKDQKGNRGKDIFRAEFKDVGGVLLPFGPAELDRAMREDAIEFGTEIPDNVRYNSDADDEFPFISPDRRAIFLTSNRESDFGKRNIYAYTLPESKVRLIVKVKEQIFNENGDLILEPTYKQGLPLELIDVDNNSTREISSGEAYEIETNKSYRINLSTIVEEDCYTNKVEGGDELTLTTTRPFGLDTTYVREFLISRRKIEIEPIVFHSTDSLPYFITGYWYPNTSENYQTYEKREARGFFNSTGFVDSTGVNYYNRSLMIDSIFNARVYEPLEDILPNFQDFCRDTLYLKVTIHGYTDPRGLSGGEDHPYRPKSKGKREYPDQPVTVGTDINGNLVTINTGFNMLNPSWTETIDGERVKIELKDDGENGNVLLSKLRAYFTFATFDNDMSERSQIYSYIKDNGRVILDAEGFGVDKEGYEERRLRDDPMSRRIEIYIDILRPYELANHKRMKGGKLEKDIYAENVPAKKKKTDKVVVSNEELANTMQNDEATIIQKQSELPVRGNTANVDQDALNTVSSDGVKTIERSSTDEVISSLPPAAGGDPEKYKNCYSLQYYVYESEIEANNAREKLLEGGLDDARVLSMIDAFGNESYRLRSGCYDTAQEAARAVMNNRWAVETLGMKKKPDIVR